MKLFSKPVLFFLLALCMSFTAWVPNNSTGITSYYYYKGQPFNLTLHPGVMFVKLNKELSETRFNEMISSLGSASLRGTSSYIQGDKKYFINFPVAISEQSITEAMNRINSNPDVQYTSPVFSPDNGTTLIGMEDEVIVQFKNNVSANDAGSILASKNFSIIKDMQLGGGISYLIKVPQNVSAINAANELYLEGRTNWAEPNLLYTNVACYTPNDPFYSQQWSLNNLSNNIPNGITGIVDCDMDVDSVWDVTLGASYVKIAISDSGVDTLHEDLVANMVVGSGYDFWNNDPWAWDDYNHGTACAGIVAAVGNNNIGISGVAPNCKLIPVKWIAGSGNGNYAGATNATTWSYQQGAWIISNSWGFVGGSSSALDQAILDAVTLGRNGKGSLFVVASGNEGNSTPGQMRFPASTNPNCLVVGGISPCNQRKSNVSCDNETFWGASWGTNIDVVAPCVKIYTTDRTGSAGYTSGNYQPIFNGTSSATPNVAGVCALAFSMDSTLTWSQLRNKVVMSCEKRGNYVYDQPGPRGLGSWNTEMGYGLVNARYLLSGQVFTGITQVNEIADKFSLGQNYPNPFNPTTNISFSIPKTSNVTVKVFDATGREIATLVNESLNAGVYNVNFDASKLSSGVYFYRLEAGAYTAVRKMALIK